MLPQNINDEMTADAMIDDAEEAAVVDRDALLASLSRIIADKRKAAVAWREQSGIEEIWGKCEEAYEGYDDLSRDDATRLGAKPTTLDAPLRSDRKSTRSRVFLNITRPYVDAASSRVGDMLLPTEDRPWGLEETSIPKLSPLMESQTPLPGVGVVNDGQVAQATVADKAKAEMATARKLADKAESQISDWLEECQWTNEVRKVINDCARIGTGILKGPVPTRKRSRMVKQDEFGNTALVMVDDVVPGSVRVDPWDFYPDPAAGEAHQNGAYVFERDRLTERRLQELAGQDGYFPEAIREVIEQGPGKKYETTGRQDTVSVDELYEVWYYHGAMSRADLEELGVDVGEDAGFSLMAIVTLVNDQIIKAAISPLDTGDFPYDVMPWQRRKGMCFGIGVAEQGATAQRMLNAAGRQLMDNSGLSVGPQIVRRAGVLVPADGRNELVAMKQWILSADADVADINQAIAFINIPSMQAEISNIMQFAMKFMEDSTGLPMLLQGQQAGATDTVGGMILLNNNAGTVLRNIARTFDDRITEPHIKRYYDWMMMYGPDDCKGDMQVKTYGSSALVERDVANQDIQFIGQLIPNFQLFGIDPERWFAEWAKSRRLSPDAFQMDAEKKQQMQQAAQQQGPSPQQITAEASMKVAETRSQADLAKAQLVQQSDMAELQFKAQEAERQREHERQMKNIELQLKMMEFSQAQNMSLEQIKAQLAMKAQDSRDKRELMAAELVAKNRFGSGI